MPRPILPSPAFAGFGALSQLLRPRNRFVDRTASGRTGRGFQQSSVSHRSINSKEISGRSRTFLLLTSIIPTSASTYPTSLQHSSYAHVHTSPCTTLVVDGDGWPTIIPESLHRRTFQRIPERESLRRWSSHVTTPPAICIESGVDPIHGQT